MPYDYNTPFNPRIEKNTAFSPEAISVDTAYIINFELTRICDCYIHLDSTVSTPHSPTMEDLRLTIETLHELNNNPVIDKNTIFRYIDKAYKLINEIDDTLISRYTLKF